MRNRENELRREKIKQTSSRLASKPLDDDEDGHLNRLWSKAKGFAGTRKKSSIPVRYSRAGQEDQVELLKVNGSDNESSTSPRKPSPTYRSSGSGSSRYSSNNTPKKGIFDDI